MNGIFKTAFTFFAISMMTWLQAMSENECISSSDDGESFDWFWVDTEYLYWKIKDSPDPVPLLATAPFITNHGPVIGQPGADVVLGNRDVHNNWRSGGKFTLGMWFDDEGSLGSEVNYFFLNKGSKTKTIASSGLPGSEYLSVPFFDITTRRESSSSVAEPGSFAALVKLRVRNGMQGAELNGLTWLYSNCNFKARILAGLRYWNFNETLQLFVNSPAINAPAEIYNAKDKFRVKNNFYGGQIGLGFDYSMYGFFVNATGKIALGTMCQDLVVKGKFICNDFNGFGEPQKFTGGYFGLPTNIGHHDRVCFAFMPEVNINVGYQIWDRFRIKLGYTFLYVNNVLWAGKQINRNINPTQSALYEFTPTPILVGQARPKASLKSHNLWAQGLNAGIEFQF